MREVILAEHAGFCFGVRRAITKAFELSGSDKKVFTFGELIHNSDVVKDLKSKNINAISEKDFGEVTKQDTVLIRSHGVTRDRLDEISGISDDVVDLTCPYVSNIQRKVSEFHNKGYRIIIMGDRNHPEVVGINGWCDNTALISKGGEVDFTIPGRICVVSQTTEKQANWEKLIARLSRDAREMYAFNTICAATQERQGATEKLAREMEAMVVIGGKHSSNTNKLYEICKSHCENTWFVENAEELKEHIEELKEFKRIGVTAGASTPDWIIKEAMELL